MCKVESPLVFVVLGSGCCFCWLGCFLCFVFCFSFPSQQIHSNVVKDDLCTIHTWRLHPCKKITLFSRVWSNAAQLDPWFRALLWPDCTLSRGLLPEPLGDPVDSDPTPPVTLKRQVEVQVAPDTVTALSLAALARTLTVGQVTNKDHKWWRQVAGAAGAGRVVETGCRVLGAGYAGAGRRCWALVLGNVRWRAGARCWCPLLTVK